MNTSTRYENAAPTWSKKLLRRGYTKAYSGFLVGSALASGAVLDVGTGTGAFALSWVEAGGSTDLTLIDPSTAMLEQASSHFAQLGLCPKAVNCGFEDFSNDTKFGAILASHVLEHFADPLDAMHQFAQNLSSGGCLYLIVSKPHWCNWLIWLRFRHRWFRPEIIRGMAQDAGLTELRLHIFRTGPPSRTSLGYIFSKP
ncbi:MAG: class I SAM-dependent methyltransferase [Rhodobacteraceae bacterium]|nr:class I SAM-dependent methyltransferase [Paracoccaceae bacterium]